MGPPRLWKLLICLLVLQTIYAQDCGDDDFTCSNGDCITAEQQCDGHEDCDHGEDELHCSKRECASSEFQCNDGRCISKENVCDGIKHCHDEEDEDCEFEGDECGVHEFQCLLDRVCIPMEYRCNSRLDCFDGSDEKGCESCKEDDFHCDNGHCIPMSQRCDRFHQCSDGSDEKGCKTETCSTQEFTCLSGECINDRDYCNGIADCDDGSDERDCPRKCDDRYEFTCSDGSCIAKENHCNDNDDCPDGSDEIGCDDNSHLKSLDHHHNRASATHHPHHGQHQPAHGNRCGRDNFQCHDGICIAGYKKCNGIVDCHDESDELDCPYANEDDDEICSSDEFYCDGRCLDNSFRCDGRIDCQNAEDEDDCEIAGKVLMRFICND
ncbi:very low-density lipoprotein receptor-like isoform X1 [Ochlerotatus camptorhynchus]|uniref:very low-density lipoprotein receptor-like isoform X1 n=1 Tax=Ochlerotatus camptorhynchus TaxID=644619 RepID=UPI0031DCF8A3